MGRISYEVFLVLFVFRLVLLVFLPDFITEITRSEARNSNEHLE